MSKGFTLVAGYVNYNKNYEWYEVSGFVNGRVRADRWVFVINPDGNVYDAYISGISSNEMFNGAVEEGFAKFFVKTEAGQTVSQLAVITDIWPFGIEQNVALTNPKLCALICENNRPRLNQIEIAHNRALSLPFNVSKNFTNDIYEKPELVANELFVTVKNSEYITFVLRGEKIAQNSDSGYEFSRENVAAIPKFEKNGESLLPVYTDWFAAGEAAEAGFYKNIVVDFYKIDYSDIRALAEYCDGFVINPFSKNHIAFEGSDIETIDTQAACDYIYHGDRKFVDIRDYTNGVFYKDPAEEIEPVVYYMLADEPVGEKLFGSVTCAINKLRNIDGEQLYINLDYKHPGKVYTIEIRKKVDSYSLNVSRFVKGGRNDQVCKTGYGEKYRIYRYPSDSLQQDELQNILKKILLENSMPKKIAWIDVTAELIYENCWLKAIKIIAEQGYFDYWTVWNSVPFGENVIEVLCILGVINEDVNDDGDTVYELIMTAEELHAKFPKAFKKIDSKTQVIVIDYKSKLYNKLSVIDSVEEGNRAKKYLVKNEELKIEEVLEEKDFVVLHC